MSRTRIFKAEQLSLAEITRLAKSIEQGAVAVLPTDTVYGIGTGAYAAKSIQAIYEIKQRPATTPLQILTGSLAQAQVAAEFSPAALRLARQYWPGALTLILPPTPEGKPLARGFAGIGFRVPGHPFLVELLCRMSVPMACTSANLHGQPTLTEEQVIVDTFDGKVDYIFLAGTLSPVASSVVDMTQTPRLLREGILSRAVLEKTLGQPF